MIFTETKINGVCIIEPELLTDERGFFARSSCKEEFQKQGLETDIVPCNISYNNKKGTIRERHFQVPPFKEITHRIALLTRHPECDGIFNCCSGQPISVRCLVEEHLIRCGVHIKHNLGHYPYPDFEPMAFWGDCRRFDNILSIMKFFHDGCFSS